MAHSFKRQEENYDGHLVEEPHRAIYSGVINRTGTGEVPDTEGVDVVARDVQDSYIDISVCVRE